MLIWYTWIYRESVRWRLHDYVALSSSQPTQPKHGHCGIAFAKKRLHFCFVIEICLFESCVRKDLFELLTEWGNCIFRSLSWWDGAEGKQRAAQRGSDNLAQTTTHFTSLGTFFYAQGSSDFVQCVIQTECNSHRSHLHSAHAQTNISNGTPKCVWAITLCQPLVEVQQATQRTCRFTDGMSHTRPEGREPFLAVTFFASFILFPWFTPWLFGLGPASLKWHPAFLALAFLLLLLLRSVASIACFPLLYIFCFSYICSHLYVFFNVSDHIWRGTQAAVSFHGARLREGEDRKSVV